MGKFIKVGNILFALYLQLTAVDQVNKTRQARFHPYLSYIYVCTVYIRMSYSGLTLIPHGRSPLSSCISTFLSAFLLAVIVRPTYLTADNAVIKVRDFLVGHYME